MNETEHPRDVNRAEEGVLEALHERNTATALDDLLKSVREKGYDDDTLIKAAIWHLISDSKVELTADQKLVLVSKAA